MKMQGAIKETLPMEASPGTRCVSEAVADRPETRGTLPKWLDDAVVYAIYPQSFKDDNGDGIGDIRGVIAKLDYVKSLGVTAIWLNPCFQSPFQDAGYDVSDYCKVAPRYGTNEDLRELFEQAHQRGLKVLLDLVAGHTSIEHPWFKESCMQDRNKYSNYYIWTNDWLDSDGGRFINGHAERNGNFMINFFHCQPALNYGYRNPDLNYPWQLPMDHPDVKAVREELRNIMKFWLDMGCDGFRVDMAASLVRGSNADEGIVELWQDYRGWLDKNYPEAVLVSEWCDPAKSINAGFHVDFMVHFGLPGYTSLFRKEGFRESNSPFAGGNSYFDKAGKGDVKAFADELLAQLASTKGKGHVSLPTGNHDIGRIRQGRDDNDLKVVYACLFTLPGVPFIYYGDEIGMDYVKGLKSKEGGYNRTGSRTPMQWEQGPNAGFSVAAQELFYLPLDPADDRPCVSEQQKDPGSLLNFVRSMVSLRRENPALAGPGDFKPLFAEKDQYPFIYRRATSDSAFVVALNPSDSEVTATLDSKDCAGLVEVIGQGFKTMISGDKTVFKMAPCSFVIYRSEPDLAAATD